MPALRSFTAEFLRELRDAIEPSVVQLAVFSTERVFAAKEDEAEPTQLGTGIVLFSTPKSIGIITTVNCDPAEKNKVVARFRGQLYLEAEVVMQRGLLFGLVIRGDNLDTVACTPASFCEGELLPSGPVFVVGCHGITRQQIIVSGMTSVEEFIAVVRKYKVSTFVHSCPIGDGLIGAPVLNQYGKVLGMNVARTPYTSKVNYALKNAQLRKMLAVLVGTELKPETRMADLLELFSQKISNPGLAKRKRSVKRKGTTIDTGARQ